ncbi:ABC transporter ATP-binding protein [Oceanirhabdus sp. W0125-5]|uniref:ABC transporter ATP-binding protein n=1 Tax=Oceanirhabdus sp. W0125-5 TaxID=2999116 RepID=UPI0022F3211D|nr:ABC transporter ATP-binding protein [Oceanirhabdus sp. W0125-5]WBW94673.1 ABC transporter ATP-binding protein [Oceanirhabdus sp. W0125-5]
MIRGKGIYKSFDENKVLKGVDINIHKGSIYGLVGENGCGKSTLLKILNGIYHCDKGVATWCNEGIFENPEIKEKIFFMNEAVYNFFGFSVKSMAKFLSTQYKSFSWERFKELEGSFKFSSSKKMNNLSKGQKKQAMFWIAFSLRPEVMILDEPLDGLDPMIRKRIKEMIINETADREMTTIISSHNLLELEDLCDHIGILSNGKIIIEKDLDELKMDINKVQYVCDSEDYNFLEDDRFEVLSTEKRGKFKIAIVRGYRDEIIDKLEYSKVGFYDIMPLTLEEIFIAELEGKEYEYEKIMVR